MIYLEFTDIVVGPYGNTRDSTQADDSWNNAQRVKGS